MCGNCDSSMHIILCYTEKAEQAQQHPGIKTIINPAEDNRKKQCRPNDTKRNSNAIHPLKRHNDPTIATPQAASSQRTHFARPPGFARVVGL